MRVDCNRFLYILIYILPYIKILLSHLDSHGLDRLTVTEEGESVATLPVLTTGRTLDLVVKVTLADTT